MYDGVITLIKDLFDNLNEDYKNTWEFFKYKVRQIAVKRSKEINEKNSSQLDSELINTFYLL